ncbi:MAG: LptE family protein [Bacteroidia bacterium]|nr:LptE family protein [Bacteroidia bacterium]
MIKKTIKLLSVFAGILALIFVVNACKFPKYGFTGASISSDVKTVFIDFFTNRARVVNPMLSQTFTEKMKDKFVNETGLSMDDKQGDLEFGGEITGYEVRPLSIQQSEQGRDFASMNRLTVTVKVVFTNNKDHEQDFNTSFSAYYDWESTRSLNDVENDAVTVIVEQLVDDIFNKSVANW